MEDRGVGTTINIGSRGVLFTTDRPLSIGGVVEAFVNWPAILDGACGLTLVISGPVVRSDENRAVIRIKHYEFRTRALHASGRECSQLQTGSNGGPV